MLLLQYLLLSFLTLPYYHVVSLDFSKAGVFGNVHQYIFEMKKTTFISYSNKELVIIRFASALKSYQFSHSVIQS